MNRLFCLTLAIFLIPLAHANLQVEHPSRSHGYFIGDVLLQRINLNATPELIVTPQLQDGQRVDTWLNQLPLTNTTVEQQWLELRYQIINSPPTPQTISLPAITFKTHGGDELLLESWPFTVSPLISSIEAGGSSASSLLPDRDALDVIGSKNSNALKLSLAALLATLAAWLLWRLFTHFRDVHILPFAKANNTINRLPRAKRDSDPDAFIALHHAFNSVAGKTISTGSLSQLFDAAPWLTEFKKPVENFYESSAVRFFQQADTPPSIAVTDLCATLYRAEKRQVKVVSDSSAA